MTITRPVVAALAAGLVLSACTATVAGQGRPLPSSGPAGTTPSTPTADPTPAPPVSAGTVVESHRIAGATLLVGEVLPDLGDSCSPSGPAVEARDTETDLGLFPPGTAADILTSYGFVAGWAYCAAAADVRQDVVFVAEMSDPDSAVVAATELATALAVDGYAPTELADLPTARALLLADTAAGGESVSTLRVLLPADRMLVYLEHADVDTEQATTNATSVLTGQADLLAGFEPTPQDRVAALNPDPFGLAAHVADPPIDSRTDFSGSYDLDSYLRVAISPARERAVLLANGYVGTYVKQTGVGDGRSYQLVVYEMGSKPEADATFTEFRDIETEEFSGTRFTVPADLTIPCFFFEVDPGGGLYYQRCYTREGKYLASIDVYGVLDPADTAQIRMLNTAQIAAMRR